MAMMACNSGADVVDDGGDGCLTETVVTGTARM